MVIPDGWFSHLLFLDGRCKFGAFLPISSDWAPISLLPNRPFCNFCSSLELYLFTCINQLIPLKIGWSWIQIYRGINMHSLLPFLTPLFWSMYVSNLSSTSTHLILYNLLCTDDDVLCLRPKINETAAFCDTLLPDLTNKIKWPSVLDPNVPTITLDFTKHLSSLIWSSRNSGFFLNPPRYQEQHILKIG